jgi:hypothetical protein
LKINGTISICSANVKLKSNIIQLIDVFVHFRKYAKPQKEMKLHLVFLQVVIAAYCCSCLGSLNSLKTSKEASLPTNSNHILLEVVTTASGAVYPKEGDILQMRLFADGHFEYDDFPDYNPPEASSRNVSVTKKEAKLTVEQVNELILLAKQPDFLAAQEKYESFYQGYDSNWVTKVKFKHQGVTKEIVADNFWGTQYHPKLKSKYPPSMVRLLKRVEELKAESIGRTSTQWLKSER